MSPARPDMIQVYGIPNCDSVRKTLSWFVSNDIPYTFHDFRKEGLQSSKLEAWINKRGLDIVLNKKSSTYRSLSVSQQKLLSEEETAISIIQAHTNLVKRPVVECKSDVEIGFNEEKFSKYLKK